MQICWMPKLIGWQDASQFKWHENHVRFIWCSSMYSKRSIATELIFDPLHSAPTIALGLTCISAFFNKWANGVNLVPVCHLTPYCSNFLRCRFFATDHWYHLRDIHFAFQIWKLLQNYKAAVFHLLFLDWWNKLWSICRIIDYISDSYFLMFQFLSLWQICSAPNFTSCSAICNREVEC